MEKRVMEKLHVTPSLLGYGCMRFPLDAEGRIEEAKAQALIADAYHRGVNYFDSAYYYHDEQSEPFLGRALQKYDRSSYYLATKLPIWALKNREEVRVFVEEQLRRLQTDYIDFYLIHALDRKRWNAVVKHEVLSILEELRAEGKLRYIGFSFHDDFDTFEEILRAYPWDFCQIQLNYMDTEEQAGMKGYHLAEEMGVPLVIMEPVRGGALADLSDEMNGWFREGNPQASVASYAMRFVAELPNVKVILSGMSNLEQIRDNAETLSPAKPLQEKEREIIQKVKQVIQSRVQNGCTGCGYCMPCPQGVDIPGNFKLWNTYHMYQSYGIIDFNWSNLSPKAKADRCIQCRQCEEKCPQKITISADMPKVWEELSQPKWK